jgi:hypothetical protein
MAALLLLLTAVDESLGGCFFGVPPERHSAVLDAFGIPANRRIVGVVSLGHPAPDRRSPSLRRDAVPSPRWRTTAASAVPSNRHATGSSRQPVTDRRRLTRPAEPPGVS